jgi:inhibitor of KinA sporulation pathway (predicted exonuclease)
MGVINMASNIPSICNTMEFPIATFGIFILQQTMISLKDAIEETGVEKRGILYAAYDDAVNAALVMQKVMSKGWTYERSQLSVAM